jgi:hypothetical protein
MTDLIQLTDTEIAAVAGGAITQSISIVASQSNSSSVTQSATAVNTGAVSATASGTGSTAAAAGAEASNIALVSQTNAIVASNSIRFGHH